MQLLFKSPVLEVPAYSLLSKGILAHYLRNNVYFQKVAEAEHSSSNQCSIQRDDVEKTSKSSLLTPQVQVSSNACSWIIFLPICVVGEKVSASLWFAVYNLLLRLTTNIDER